MSEMPKLGTFCWNELMTNDVEKAKEFYSTLLGWETEPMPGGMPYTILKAGDKQAGGMMAITPEMGQVPPHWAAYVTVENCDEASKKAEELGATTIVPPTDIPEVGRFTVIADPTGATIGLISFPKG